MRPQWNSFLCSAGIAVFCSIASGQTLEQIMARLDRLETQNQSLREQISGLRAELAAMRPADNSSPKDEPPIAERVAVAEQHISDLAQSRVASDHRMSVTLTGTMLFNAYLNGARSAGQQYPTRASAGEPRVGAGASVRQTIVGLKFDGPDVLGGGKLSGSVYADFFGGGNGLDQVARLRTARVDVDWRKTSFMAGFEKPLIAMRDPDSFAQVGVSPLTAAGNLWLWQPQVRVERRISFRENAGLRGQFSLYQTQEAGTGLTTDTLASARPGYQGRVEFWSGGETRRLEIAPGFHLSSTRAFGISIPSRIFAVDWLIRPMSRVDLTGTFFHGENVAVLGSTRQSVGLDSNRRPAGVPSTGGWAQLKFRVTPRGTFNFFGGQQDDQNSYLDRSTNVVLKNQNYGANFMYRWGSNVITSIEASQVRTHYAQSGIRLNPHYDLAIAYLF